jgi:hypothetical protein
MDRRRSGTMRMGVEGDVKQKEEHTLTGTDTIVHVLSELS